MKEGKVGVSEEKRKVVRRRYEKKRGRKKKARKTNWKTNKV